MKWRNRKFYLAGVILLGISAAVLGRCADTVCKKRTVSRALEQKYQEKFEILCYRKGGIFRDYDTVQAYAVEYPELIFEASIEKGSGAIMDEYAIKRLCDRLSKKISQNLETLENDYYVFTEAMFSASLVTDQKISMEEYIGKEPENSYTIYLCLDEEGASVQNIIDASINMMNGIPGIKGSVSFYLADAELLSDIREYVKSHDTTYAEFDDMTEEAWIGSVSFENGSFCLTEEDLRTMAGNRLL